MVSLFPCLPPGNAGPRGPWAKRPVEPSRVIPARASVRNHPGVGIPFGIRMRVCVLVGYNNILWPAVRPIAVDTDTKALGWCLGMRPS